MPTKILCRLTYAASPDNNPSLFAAYDDWLQSFAHCEFGQCGKFYNDYLFYVSRPRGQMTSTGLQLVEAVSFAAPVPKRGRTTFDPRTAGRAFRVFRQDDHRARSIRVEIQNQGPVQWDDFQAKMQSELLAYKLRALPMPQLTPAQPQKTCFKQKPVGHTRHAKKAIRRIAKLHDKSR